MKHLLISAERNLKMTKFVGAEYLIASMLIEKKKHGINCVTLDELGRCGVYIQQMSVEQKINAVFLTSRPQFYNAIFDFSDYFECTFDSDNQLTGITIQQSKSIDDLEYRFVGRLPKAIFDFLLQITKEYVA